MSLLDAIKTQAQITDKVLVSFSMGKDSIVTLDLCMKYFKTVQPFFMYLVPDLKFQEEALAKYERHYGVDIIRVPHFENADFYRYGSFRDADYSVPRVKIRAIYEAIRRETGIQWIAGGEKIRWLILLSLTRLRASSERKIMTQPLLTSIPRLSFQIMKLRKSFIKRLIFQLMRNTSRLSN